MAPNKPAPTPTAAPTAAPSLLPRRAALSAALAAAFAAVIKPPAATAETAKMVGAAPAAAAGAASSVAAPAAATTTATVSASIPTVYFGSGCFWGRQHDFVMAERDMGRGTASAVVGYAGGAGGADEKGRVCYYYASDASVYEKRGHAEVVRLALVDPMAAGATPTDADTEAAFRQFARVFFRTQFVKRRDGRMSRQDPQDAGPGYRNVVGVPGGIKSKLYKILVEENVNGMTLVEGKGTGNEPDLVNTVYVVDSDKLPFYAAENWHQYHDGIGYSFPKAYKRDAKRAAVAAGAVPKPGETNCPEFGFL